ncbi:aldo/keto reductase [Sphingomonas sp. CFBP 8760]|uniref:aldo/keto reductase n=1 Tax=Sphingomonas sp. CFBP 8760 TaxID=2775282 RepID=UPI00177B7133|nr:aldo/keto reductase [Sphingomonas sp. CFBP 8760]MBD8546741.1 aldo/keto reductase [Sphingomonas sp. CFBP 8760]
MTDARPALPTRPLGKSGLRVTELAFGAASLGNLNRRVDDATAQAAVHAAVTAGINLVDTAPFYGRGLSERRVGDALREGDRSVILSTKAGRLLVPDASVTEQEECDGFLSPMPFRIAYDYSRDGILRSFEASLHRLGLDRIDILLVHDIGRYVQGDAHDGYWDQLTRGGGFDALVSLRDQGAIRAFGLGVNEVQVCIDAINVAPLDVLLLANRYTLLEQTPLDSLFPLCVANGVSVIAGAPYNSGILATGTRGHGVPFYDYGPAPVNVIERVRLIETIADTWQVPLAAAALQFPLAHPCVAAVLPGINDPRRMAETLDLYHFFIPIGFWSALADAGLLCSV